MINEYSSIWWNEYIEKRPYKCCDCKFANEYLAYWWFPYFDPTCSKGNPCSPNKDACSKFQMIGRLSK